MRSMSRTARGPKRAPARLVTPRSIGTPTSAMSSPPKSGRSGASGRNGRSSRVETPANGIARWYRLPNTKDSAFRKSSGATSVSRAPSYLARNASSFALSNMVPLMHAAHPRQDQMLPRVRHFADCNLDQGRAAPLQRRGELAAQPVGGRRTHPGGAKALRHLREIRVVQIDPDQTVAVILFLHAADIAVSAVGENDRHDVDAVFDRGRKLLDVVHEPAIARDRNHGEVRPAQIGAERRRKAETQSALVAAMDVGERVIDRERHASDISDLRQIFDIDSFVR